MQNFYDDSDMKISGKEYNNTVDSFDTSAFLEETGKQHFNGNVTKARSLGSDIVSAFSYKNVPEHIDEAIKSYGLDKSSVLLTEIKILAVFCAEYSMKRCLTSPLLSAVAASEMFGVMQKLMPEFYEQLSHSASFSFYYICIKNKEDEDLPKEIGKAFAEMCDDPKNANIIAFAADLFERNMSVFKKAISGYGFV